MSVYLFSVALIFSALGLSGCSLEVHLEDLNAKLPAVFSKSTTAEIVANSKQGVITTDGYRVQSSVSYYATPATVQTHQKYRVETSVQSALYGEVQ